MNSPNWNTAKWENCRKSSVPYAMRGCGESKLRDARPCGRFQAYPQSLKNALSIMYSKEDILFKALNVNESRVERWCQKVREPMLEKIRKLPTNTTMDRLRQEWYEGSDGSYEHYNWTRYYALNLHSVFYRGTLEWRCFESTLHAGKVRANNYAGAGDLRTGHQPEPDGHAQNRDQRKPRLYLPHLSFAPWPHRTGIQKCAGASALEPPRRPGMAI